MHASGDQYSRHRCIHHPRRPEKTGTQAHRHTAIGSGSGPLMPTPYTWQWAILARAPANHPSTSILTNFQEEWAEVYVG